MDNKEEIGKIEKYKGYKIEEYDYKDYKTGKLIKEKDDNKITNNNDNYMDKNIKLNDKKEKLWKGKNIEDWEIERLTNDEKLLLFNDKKYAFDRMCTSETKNIKNLYDMLCY